MSVLGGAKGGDEVRGGWRVEGGGWSQLRERREIWRGRECARGCRKYSSTNTLVRLQLYCTVVQYTVPVNPSTDMLYNHGEPNAN